MASFRFSVRARDDLRDIGEFTTRTWNEAQAVRYLVQLEDHPLLPASTREAVLRRRTHSKVF